MDDARLRLLTDESEIRNLVARLAHLADLAPTLDEYLTCFTEDAVWEYSEAARATVTDGRPGLRVEGRAAIAADRQRLRGDRFQGPGTNTFHVNTTLAVRVLSETEAEAQSYWLFVSGQGAPQVSKLGHYHDYFRRTSEGWKLARRVVTPNAM
jgi:hypothetical protein